MKKIIILIFTLCFSYNSFSQSDVFYSIEDSTGNLVYIDTLWSVTIVGPTVSPGGIWGGLVFKDGSLYLSNQDSLYIVDIVTEIPILFCILIHILTFRIHFWYLIHNCDIWQHILSKLLYCDKHFDIWYTFWHFDTHYDISYTYFDNDNTFCPNYHIVIHILIL